MKSILFKLFSVSLVITVAIAATNAWFTAQAQSDGNNAGAGKINLTVNNSLWSTTPIIGPIITVTGLEPDAWYAKGSPAKYFGPLTINNPNTPDSLHFKYRFRSQKTSETVAGFFDLLKIRVYRKESGSFVNKWEGYLKDLDVNQYVVSAMADLAPNSTHEWKFDLGLDSRADNIYQGASATFSLVVEATQVGNPGWTE